MKAFLYKAKGAVALTLAMSLFCPQVFAAEALSAEQQGVKAPPVVELTEEEKAAQELPEITVEEALEKAIKHSPDLLELSETIDYLEETDEDMYNMTGWANLPSYETKKWNDDGVHQLVNAMFGLEHGKKQARIGEQVQKMVLEVTVRSSFSAIKQDEANLALLQKSADIAKTQYEQGYAKYRLGMLSQYNLDQLKVAAQQAKDTVTMLEAGLEQKYIKFNDLIGENSAKRFKFVYDLTFEPYEMGLSMEQYINAALKDDLTIQLKELSLEQAKFTNNFRPYSSTKAQGDQDELSYDQAKRALKNARTDKELLIRNTYLTLQQLETSYESAQSALTKAQADLRVTKINYELGNVTKLVVEQTEMAVINAENALNQIVYNYDMLRYTFENPSLLADTGAAQ